jgi:hypothetical protein
LGSLGISVSSFSSWIHLATTFVDTLPCSMTGNLPEGLSLSGFLVRAALVTEST